jgi:hypothetical protein
MQPGYCRLHGQPADYCAGCLTGCRAALAAAEAENARLRNELRERRTCLAGAKETCRMSAAVFRNAKTVDAFPSYAAAVEERIDLIQQAIDNTDAALASQPGEEEAASA